MDSKDFARLVSNGRLPAAWHFLPGSMAALPDGDIIDAQTLRVFNIKLLVWSFLIVRWITELERRVREGFKGAVINGHNQGRYLDNQFYWPILECAEALNVPIYLHPTPPPQPVIEASYSGFSPMVTDMLAG